MPDRTRSAPDLRHVLWLQLLAIMDRRLTTAVPEHHVRRPRRIRLQADPGRLTTCGADSCGAQLMMLALRAPRRRAQTPPPLRQSQGW